MLPAKQFPIRKVALLFFLRLKVCRGLCGMPKHPAAAETTDKGSINQRAVLDHRASLVEEIQAAPPSRTLCANLRG